MEVGESGTVGLVKVGGDRARMDHTDVDPFRPQLLQQCSGAAPRWFSIPTRKPELWWCDGGADGSAAGGMGAAGTIEERSGMRGMSDRRD